MTLAGKALIVGVTVAGAFGCTFTMTVSNCGPMKPASRCLSNLKQIGIAALLYGEDCDQFPSASGWQERLAPYTKSTDVFRCAVLPREGSALIGYATNSMLGGQRTTGRDLSRTPYSFDVDDLAPSAVATRLRGSDRHKGGANVVFVDWHAAHLTRAHLGSYSLLLPPVREALGSKSRRRGVLRPCPAECPRLE